MPTIEEMRQRLIDDLPGNGWDEREERHRLREYATDAEIARLYQDEYGDSTECEHCAEPMRFVEGIAPYTHDRWKCTNCGALRWDTAG